MGFKSVAFYLTDALGLYVQNTAFALLFHLTNSCEAGAIEIAGKFCVLHERSLLDQIFELLVGDEEVLLSMKLSWSWTASGVGNAEPKFIGKFRKETVQKSTFPDTRWPRENKGT